MAASTPAEAPEEEEAAPPPAVSASGHSVQVAAKKKIREPAQSRFGAAAAAASSGTHKAGPQAAPTTAESDLLRRPELGLGSAAAAVQPVSSVPVSVAQVGDDVIKASRPAGALAASPATIDELAARKKADELAAQQKKDADLVEARRKAATAAGASLANAAAGRAAALAATPGSENEEEEDVQLSAEELGFPSDSVDAFAGKPTKPFLPAISLQPSRCKVLWCTLELHSNGLGVWEC